MSFGGLFITNRGRALQAKAQTGVQLNFTKFAVGDGQLGGQSISELTGLIHQIKTIELNKFKPLPGGKAVVGGVLSNQDIVTGFYWRELGVFAQDPDLGEILYCYGNAGDLAEYIPAPGGAEILEKQVDVVTLVGNAPNVSASIEQSLVYITQGEKGEPGGVASLDEAGKVPGAQLPVFEVPVTSVNTQTGDVVLSAADVGAETPEGAEAKAVAAEGAANAYTDQEVGAVAQAQASHEAEKATDLALGHVKVDDATIEADANGVISVPSGTFAPGDAVWQKLSETILESNALQVDINLPSGYTKYKAVINAKGTKVSGFTTCDIRLNNLSTNIYNQQQMSIVNATAAASRVLDYNAFNVGQPVGDATADNAYSHMEVEINNYPGNTYKTMFAKAITFPSKSDGNFGYIQSVCIVNTTATLTQINFIANVGIGYFAIGSKFEIWGAK